MVVAAPCGVIYRFIQGALSMEFDGREEREELERELKRIDKVLQNRVAAARKELSDLSDEQFEQVKQDAEFQGAMSLEQAKQIHDSLESEDSDVRHSGILALFGYINDRELAVSGRLDRLLEIVSHQATILKFLVSEVGRLRAEVKVLKGPRLGKERRKAKRKKR
jgi:hypothetical protein